MEIPKDIPRHTYTKWEMWTDTIGRDPQVHWGRSVYTCVCTHDHVMTETQILIDNISSFCKIAQKELITPDNCSHHHHGTKPPLLSRLSWNLLSSLEPSRPHYFWSRCSVRLTSRKTMSCLIIHLAKKKKKFIDGLVTFLHGHIKLLLFLSWTAI